MAKANLQKEVRYYPIVQLIIVALFIIIHIVAQRSRYQNTQNQVWAGLAKETAHQLGTPVTSLEGWVEVLRDIPGNEKISSGNRKRCRPAKTDIRSVWQNRQHSKTGRTNLVEQINSMIDYIKKRASGKVQFTFNTNGETNTSGHDFATFVRLGN